MSQASVQTGLALPTFSLWRREMVRFLRQRSRVIGALGTPIVFWLLIGSGLRNSFQLPGQSADAPSINYMEYSFPGMMVLIVLFTAIFSTISVIEDRREGFMQAVLTAPVDRLAIVLGKVLGSTSLALLQAMLFLLLAPLAGISMSAMSFVASFLALLLVSIGLSGLGFWLAWRMDSIQGFHAVMNLFLMPMWLLSGAFFPAAGASKWLAWVMYMNPLTYGVALVRRVMYLGTSTTMANVPPLWISLIVTLVFGGVMVALSTRGVYRKAE